MLIAQISDIHAAPDNDHLLRLERALAWLTHVQPDVLVLTGDLVDGEWLQGYWQIAEQLRQQHYPAFILPGNADDRRLMQTTWHENHWAKNTPADALHFVQDMGGLRMLGLDSTVNKQNFGSVGEHLEWLERQLSDTPALPALVFLHHPVIASGIPTLDESMCRGLDKLESILRRSRVRILAIAAGHVHRPAAGMFAGVPAYICGSICPANPLWFGSQRVPPVNDPPALMVHRFASGVLTSHHVSLSCS